MAGNNDFFNDFPATGHNLLISTLGKPYRVSEKYAKVKFFTLIPMFLSPFSEMQFKYRLTTVG